MASAAVPQARLLLLLETDPRGPLMPPRQSALSLGCQAPAPALGQPQTLPRGERWLVDPGRALAVPMLCAGVEVAGHHMSLKCPTSDGLCCCPLRRGALGPNKSWNQKRECVWSLHGISPAVLALRVGTHAPHQGWALWSSPFPSPAD